jgi:2-succinyl-6-hydroxy-2,4-cyclohexadiene-1-carboxylate synthase
MRLEVNGVHLNVEITGEGWPLVLLHGFTGSNATWEKHHAALAACFKMVAIEMLGHGLSDAPADPERYSMEYTTADIAEVLDKLEIERAAVLGYSMGGRIALHFAAAYPERVSALMLESSSPGLATAEERAARVQADEALANFIEQEGIATFVERWENLPLFASQRHLPAEVQTAQRQQRLNNNPRGLANSLRGAGIGAQESLWPRLNGLALPTLLIAGELDTKFVQIARQMQAKLPISRFDIVANAGHTVHLEQPAEFDRLVLDYLINRDAQD